MRSRVILAQFPHLAAKVADRSPSRPTVNQSDAARGHLTQYFVFSRHPRAAKCYYVLAAATRQLPHPTQRWTWYRPQPLRHSVLHAYSGATKLHEQASADENIAESEIFVDIW